MINNCFVRHKILKRGLRRRHMSALSKETAKIGVRSSIISKLQAKDIEYDVLIVGGGATGAGAALDAARRGLSVACVEREDFSSGTSSRSTKLIWGGSRYLVQAFVSLLSKELIFSPKTTVRRFLSDFKMVLNCHRERTFLLQQQPHLTSWLPIAVPLSTWIQWPPPFGFPLASVGPLGLFPLFFKFYDALSGFSCPPSHVMTPARAQRKFPQLANDVIKYCSVFYEGTHDDARTNLAIAQSAARDGAIVANYCEVVKLVTNADLERGASEPDRVVGAIVRDHVGQQEFTVRAKSVLLCGGPFTDELRALEDPASSRAVMGASGTHIVLPAYFAPSGIGLVDMNTSDGRFLFFLPWHGQVLVGTTDHKCEPSMRPAPAEEEICWLLNEASRYISPELQLRRQDVLSAWSGVRPLARDPHELDSSRVSRDHVVSLNSKTGVVFVSGGKWTTYREMAEDAVDKVVDSCTELKVRCFKSCDTLTTGLVGLEGYSVNLERVLVQQFGVSAVVAFRLVRAYGGRARDVLQVARELQQSEGEQEGGEFRLLVNGHPYLEAEVVFAARHDWAVHAEDVLARRTRLAFVHKDSALQAVPRVVALMARELQWNTTQRRAEYARCVEYLRQFGGSTVAPLTGLGSRQEVRMATRSDLREVFRKVGDQGAVGIEQLQLVGEMLHHPLSPAEVEDCMAHSVGPDGGDGITFEALEEWWNSDRLNPGLVAMREQKTATAESVEGSGTLFG